VSDKPLIVRWGIGELGPLLTELGSERPLLVTSARFGALDVPVASRFTEVRAHAPVETVAAATSAAAGADGLVGVGGGSAIDTAKAVSAATGLPLVAIPTTYAGAEWTPYFGMRDESRRVKTGGSGAHTGGVVYEPTLTLGLPVAETVGTAMNALAHAAEALYGGTSEDALTGAQLIGAWLPRVVADGHDLPARTKLLEGAMHAGKALSERGLFLAHAMAQALGGRFGVPHGAMNALCLPPALRFNAAAVPEALELLGEALGAKDPVTRVVELAQLGNIERLRDFGVPEDELPAVAEDVVARPGARANPRKAGSREVEELLRSIW
jgi:maleylacetate reductase